MSSPDCIIVPQNLLTKAQAKEEFGLTESHLVQIGEPDVTKPNLRFRSGAPIQLYSRQRVERWITEHQEELAKSESRRSASQKAVATKRAQTRDRVAALVTGLEMRPAPRRGRLESEVGLFLLDCFGDTSGEVSERALCSYLRHNYSNYEAILDSVRGLVGAGELYPAVKLYLCCQIIRRYQLNIDPLVAAFGSRDEAPDVFLVSDPQRVAGLVLGLRESEEELH